MGMLRPELSTLHDSPYRVLRVSTYAHGNAEAEK
jgi:hypothetical protein